jgi:hypothetical protein
MLQPHVLRLDDHSEQAEVAVTQWSKQQAWYVNMKDALLIVSDVL